MDSNREQQPQLYSIKQGGFLQQQPINQPKLVKNMMEKNSNYSKQDFQHDIEEEVQEQFQERSRDKSQRANLFNSSLFTSREWYRQEKFVERKRKKQTELSSNHKVFEKYTRLPSNRYLNTNHKKSPIITNELIQILLSFKFTPNISLPPVRRIPLAFNSFGDYRNIFSTLLINEVIADVYNRMKALEMESRGEWNMGSGSDNDNIEESGVPIVILELGSTQKGFIPIYIQEKISNFSGQSKLKKYIYERYELAILSHSKHFSLENYGITCPKSSEWSILCLIALPEEQPLFKSNVQLKLYGYFDRSDLQNRVCEQSMNGYIQFEANRRQKIYYLHLLDKISSHLREFNSVLAVEHSPLNSYLFNPLLLNSPEATNNKTTNIKLETEQLLERMKVEYNQSQYLIIKNIALKQKGIYMLQGPPGTGKTTTLLGMLAVEYHFLTRNKKSILKNQKNNRKILVCAPSNATIDHITKLIMDLGLLSYKGTRVSPKILRVGRNMPNKKRNKLQKEKIDRQILQVSLQYLKATKVKQVLQQNKKNQKLRRSILERKLQIQNMQKMANVLEKQILMLRDRYSQKDQGNITENKTFKENIIDEELEQTILRKQQELQKLKSQTSKKIDRIEASPPVMRLSTSMIGEQVERKLLNQTEIILTTLNSSGVHNILECLKNNIECLIVDEAVQATQPSILVPLATLCKKMVLIGDPWQLPSMVLSKTYNRKNQGMKESEDKQLDRSLFERLLDCQIEPYFLNKQYRMAPLIREFPSTMFYENRLEDDSSISKRYKSENQKLKSIQQFISPNSPNNNIFMDIANGIEEQCPYTKSFRNLTQISVIVELLIKLIRFKDKDLSIGVITPYSWQALSIKKKLKEVLKTRWLAYKNRFTNVDENSNVQNNPKKEEDKEEGQISEEQLNQQQKCQGQNRFDNRYENYDRLGPSSKPLQNIQISTIDSFQGKQCDIVILSTVRANQSTGEIGFIKDYRRINVALTRSRHLLFFIGNFSTLYQSGVFDSKGGYVIQSLLRWYLQKNMYFRLEQSIGEAIREFIQQIWTGKKPHPSKLPNFQQININSQIIGFKSSYKIKTRQLLEQNDIEIEQQDDEHSKIEEEEIQNLNEEDGREQQRVYEANRSAEVCTRLFNIENELNMNGEGSGANNELTAFLKLFQVDK